MSQQRWYPPPMGDPKLDDTFRIIFDNLYELRDKQGEGGKSENQSQGMTATAIFSAGFAVGGNNNNYHNLTFKNGSIVGIS